VTKDSSNEHPSIYFSSSNSWSYFSTSNYFTVEIYTSRIPCIPRMFGIISHNVKALLHWRRQDEENMTNGEECRFKLCFMYQYIKDSEQLDVYSPSFVMFSSACRHQCNQDFISHNIYIIQCKLQCFHSRNSRIFLIKP